MKTTKSIVIVLFMLLTAQIASAYYCPSTGRWLSRDPIGEPGFQALQTASSPSGIANSVLQPSGRWVNRDNSGELAAELLRAPNPSIGKPLSLHQCLSCKRRAAMKEQMTANAPNLYGYVQNDPVISVDILGLNPNITVDTTAILGRCDGNQARQIYAAYAQAMAAIQAQVDAGNNIPSRIAPTIACLMDSNARVRVGCGGCVCWFENMGHTVVTGVSGPSGIQICNPALNGGGNLLAITTLVEVAKTLVG